MKAAQPDLDAMRRIRPESLSVYLARRGWAMQNLDDPRASIWSRWNALAGENVEVLVPNTGDIDDYDLRVADVVTILAAFEGRSRFDIWCALRGKIAASHRISGADESRLDTLVRAWGLDVFGLNDLATRARWELRAAAWMLTTNVVVTATLWCALFALILRAHAPFALVVSFVLAVLFAGTEALFARQFMTAPLGKHWRRNGQLALSLVIAMCTTILQFQPFAIYLFRDPIDKYLESARIAEDYQPAPNDLIVRLEALTEIIEGDGRVASGYTSVAIMYWVLLLVLAGFRLLPLLAHFLSSAELRAYYEPESYLIKRHGKEVRADGGSGDSASAVRALNKGG